VLIREWPELPGDRIKSRSVVGADGEFELLRIGGRVLSAVDDREFIDAGVESGAELVEQLAQHDAQLLRERSGVNVDDAFPIRVYATERLIGIALQKAIPDLGEPCAVSLCAFETTPGPREQTGSRHGVTSP
jgi:hypothetical protein